ncbi:MAG: FAD-dependent oxidoreductase, partial [Nitriliruptoraceae bacterium]
PPPARQNVHHHMVRAVNCDPQRQTVTLADGTNVSYHLVSFNVGSVVATGTLTIEQGVPAMKPFDQLPSFARWLAQTTPDRQYHISIVGGGPTGLELAGQLSARYPQRLAITVFNRTQPGITLPAGARRRVLDILKQRGVQMRLAAAVQTVERDHLMCNNERHEHDMAILATGLTPTRFACDSGLGDEHGIPVRATLQHVDYDDIYAVGDGAHFTPGPLRKLGVHGVRQGPILEQSLLARRAGQPLPVYKPRQHVLRIIDLGGGTALATRGRWWAEGPLLRQLKRTIDSRWLAQYQ